MTMLTLIRLEAYTRMGPMTLDSTWPRTTRSPDAPVARAASTKSCSRTWVVTLSAMRAMGGMNTSVSDTMLLVSPAPRAPEIATASSTEGTA